MRIPPDVCARAAVHSGAMSRICRLEQVTGREAPCPEAGCPFWEPGGAVLEGRCAFERLDLDGRSQVAVELLGVRRLLESAVSEDEECHARHLFHRALNQSADE
jgi:hypothetical protein